MVLQLVYNLKNLLGKLYWTCWYVDAEYLYRKKWIIFQKVIENVCFHFYMYKSYWRWRDDICDRIIYISFQVKNYLGFCLIWKCSESLAKYSYTRLALNERKNEHWIQLLNLPRNPWYWVQKHILANIPLLWWKQGSRGNISFIQCLHRCYLYRVCWNFYFNYELT